MKYFVTGTDTDVGKTVVSAWLMLHLGARYWKPIQCGTEDVTDPEAIRSLTNCGAEDVIAPTYVFDAPLSPHEAAKRAGVQIELERFELPNVKGPLIVEGAGGLMVPLNDRHLVSDLISRLALPVILVCRSTLGTINHTLLSLEHLRQRNIPIVGVVMSGPKMSHNREAIETYGKVRVIAEIPLLDKVDASQLLSIAPEIDLHNERV